MVSEPVAASITSAPLGRVNADQVVHAADGAGKAESSRTRRLQSVDVLRGLAALAVLLFHVPPLAWHERLHERFGLWTLPLDFGDQGVTLFLVISGFCIHLRPATEYLATRNFQTDWQRFWQRRFYRLYPPYIAAIAISLAVHYAIPQSLPEQHRIKNLWPDLITHLLMVHNLTTYSLGLSNGAFWTLGLEEQLYAAFPIYLAMRRRWSAAAVVTVALAIAVFWRCGQPIAASAVYRLSGVPVTHQHLTAGPVIIGNWGTWPFAFWFSWVLGAVAAEVYVGVIRLPKWCMRYTTAAGFLALGVLLSPKSWQYFPAFVDNGNFVRLLLPPLSGLGFAVAAFIFVLRFAIAERLLGAFEGRIAKCMALLGMISYSLYLIHGPLIGLGTFVFSLGDGPADVPLRYTVLVPWCLAAAVAFHLVIERRFLNLTRKV